MRYRKFCDEMRDHARRKHFELPDCGWHATFHIKMPKSWSKKKKAEMNMKPHQVKPDTSNLLKSLEDALRPDDEKIWEVSASKRWAETGRVYVDLRDMPDEEKVLSKRTSTSQVGR